MNMQEINSVPLHHLRFEDVKGLSVEELLFLRIDAIDRLTSLEVVISSIIRADGDWHKQATVKAHLKRIIGTFNGVIASRNRANDATKAKQKEKIKAANIKIYELEAEVRTLKKLINNK